MNNFEFTTNWFELNGKKVWDSLLQQFNPSKILLKRIWTTAPSSPVAVKENTLSVPHLHAPIMPPACESSESDLVTKAIYS